MESKVLPDRCYKKQEETLIVWSEDDSCELALSFQEKLGCDEVWSRLCEVRASSVLVPGVFHYSPDTRQGPKFG